jgi:hypothetical protein
LTNLTRSHRFSLLGNDAEAPPLREAFWFAACVWI